VKLKNAAFFIVFVEPFEEVDAALEVGVIWAVILKEVFVIFAKYVFDEIWFPSVFSYFINF